ncbi:MAG: demethoxyubiquinone hydroxylase family protein [Rhizobacter sp.]
MQPDNSEDACASLTVLYDGACPLCRREISVYRSLKPRQTLHWSDVSDARTPVPPGADRAAYLARIHVQRGNGQVLSGAAAFVALWTALPGWRWLGRLGSLPGVTPVLERVYRGFLRLRPALQRMARSMEPAARQDPIPPLSAASSDKLHRPPIVVPADLIAELRSDHAGETGAVWIYHGMLAATRDRGVREFARRHRETEQRHLDLICEVLPAPQRSRLLVPWRAAGFVTGALPALCGPRAAYGTIAAVETFVDQHYQQQIDRLNGRPEHAKLRELLLECQADECAHRDEALSNRTATPGVLLRAWCAVVGGGSAAAVRLARRF